MSRGRHEARRPHRLGVGVGIAALAAVLVVGLVLLVRALSGGGGSGTTASGGTPTASRPALSRGASTSPSASATASPSPSGTGSMMPMGPTVQLRLVGTSWVQARDMPSGRVLVARVCHAGDVLTFNQQVVEVTIGNAGAVRMTANGMATPLGGTGVVRRITVTRGGD